VVAFLVALLLAAAAYALHRAWVLRLEYYDGYSYLKFAQRLLGGPEVAFEVQRPPLLPLLQVPVVALAMRGGPANPSLLVAPHLASALLSLLALAATYFAFRPALGRRGALVGVVLLAGSRWFLRYAPFVMTDLPAAGFCAAAVGYFLRAQQARRAWPLYLACGAVAGLGVAMKPTAVLVLPALGLAGLISALPRGERGRRLGGVLLLGLVAAAVAAGCYWLTFRILEAQRVWTRVHGAILKGSLMQVLPGDSWRDYFAMLPEMTPWPVLALAVAGLVVAALRRRAADLPFVLWLVIMGGGILAGLKHTEARYLIPIAPPLFYFAARAAEAGLEALSPLLERAANGVKPLVAAGAVVMLVMCLSAGVRQIQEDRDPAFTTDRERQAVALLEQSRRGSGRTLLVGEWHTLNPRHPGPVPADEFWNCFHFSRQGAEYLLGRPLPVLSRATFVPEGRRNELPGLLEDGDAVLRLDDVAFMTPAFPRRGDLRPLEVWSVDRTELRRQRGNRLASADGQVAGNLEPTGTKALRFIPETSPGAVWLYERRGENGRPTFTAAANLKRGVPIALARAHDDVTGLVLMNVQRRPIR
jgi:hypothetical protein